LDGQVKHVFKQLLEKKKAKKKKNRGMPYSVAAVGAEEDKKKTQQRKHIPAQTFRGEEESGRGNIARGSGTGVKRRRRGGNIEREEEKRLIRNSPLDKKKERGDEYSRIRGSFTRHSKKVGLSRKIGGV